MTEPMGTKRAPGSAPASAQGFLATLLRNFVGNRKAIVAVLLLGGISWLYKKNSRKTRRLKYKSVSDYSQKQGSDRDWYDVVIVGAGPAGATAGYYLAKRGIKVLVLEKRKFPRDKYCGDAVCTAAQRHLREMGVLQELMAEDKGHPQAKGGFISPCGNSYLSNTASELGFHVVIAIKRLHMDEKVAKACSRAGAELVEDRTVTGTRLDRKSRMWTVTATKTGGSEEFTYKGRLLLVCDGAPSSLGRKIGLIKTAPDGVCSRAFVKQGTHDFKQDGVVFYPPKLLPGYCSLMRHAQEEIAFCAYIIPGGDAKIDDLPKLHEEIHKTDPYVSKMLGRNAKVETMKSATLRLGGVRKSYAEQMLLVGDSAGFIDPLTGEGIQYAMDGALYAAELVEKALLEDDLSSSSMKRYQDRWMEAFGNEFYWSMKVSKSLYHYPILLDAMAVYIKQKGPEFLANWAEVMTGTKPKTFFLRPDVAVPMGWVVIQEWFRQRFGKSRQA